MRKTTRGSLAALILSGLAIASPGAVQAAPAFSLPSPTSFRNNSWAFGELFTVGSSNISVTSLGAYVDAGGGFTTPGGIPVGIFRVSDGALLASTNVLSTDTLVGNFRYDSIAPLTLQAGQQYEVVAVNEQDLYNIDTNFSVASGITLNGYAYGQSTTLQQLSNFTGNERVWFSNFQFTASSSVPEPSSLAMIATSGILGLGLVGGRRLKGRA